MPGKRLEFRGTIAELNGLRAVAATQVVLAHVWPDGNWLAPLFKGSWFALDAFFVLSGFLITGILLDSRNRPDYLGRFYVRRALRIWPLYYLLLTFVTANLYMVKTPEHSAMLSHWGSPGWFFVFLGNIPSAFATAPAVRSFSYLWSLQVQEQFYFVFPLLIGWLEIKSLKRLLWVLVFLSPAFRIAWFWHDPNNREVEYMLTLCRMEGLALGALIAIRLREGPWVIPWRKLSLGTAIWVFGLVALVALWGGQDLLSPVNRTVGLWVSSVASALVLLWLIAARGSRLTTVLRLAPLQYIGKISLGVYLLHIPASEMVSITGSILHLPALKYGVAGAAATYALAILSAAISWKFLESPILNFQGGFSFKPPVVRSMVLSPRQSD